MPMIWGVLAMLGCGGDDDPTTPTDQPDDHTGTPPTHETSGPTGTTGDTGAVVTHPEVDPPDAVAMAADLQAAIDLVPLLSTNGCYDTYAAIAAQDSFALCPNWIDAEPLGRTWARNNCVAPGGTTYAGSFTVTDDQRDFVSDDLFPHWFVPLGASVVPAYVPGAEFTGNSNGLWFSSHSSASIPNYDPSTFTVAADMRGVTALEGGVRVRWQSLEGTCTFQLPTGTWVDAKPTLWIHLAQLSPDGTSTYRTQVDGSIGNLAQPYTTAAFQSLVMTDPALPGGSCAIEPVGSVAMRHTEGQQYTVTFGGDCDGCGRISVMGQDFGEMCADFSPMLRELADTTFAHAAMP